MRGHENRVGGSRWILLHGVHVWLKMTSPRRTVKDRYTSELVDHSGHPWYIQSDTRDIRRGGEAPQQSSRRLRVGADLTQYSRQAIV